VKTRILRPLLAASLVLGFCGFGFHTAALAADSIPATSADGKKININQASAEQLSYLPRVGAKAAQKVVDYRKAKGPFARAEDLMEVKGFGEKKFEQLRPYLAVSGPTTLDAKVSSAGSRGGRSGRGSRSSSAAAPKKPASEKASSGKAASHAAPVGKGQ
jgi:competence protein ComEA